MSNDDQVRKILDDALNGGVRGEQLDSAPDDVRSADNLSSKEKITICALMASVFAKMGTNERTADAGIEAQRGLIEAFKGTDGEGFDQPEQFMTMAGIIHNFLNSCEIYIATSDGGEEGTPILADHGIKIGVLTLLLLLLEENDDTDGEPNGTA